LSEEKDIYKKLSELDNEIRNIKTILLLTNLNEEDLVEKCSTNDINLIWFALDAKKTLSEWVKLIGLNKLKKIIEDNFNEPYLFDLYEKSDGLKTTRDLATEFPISPKTVTSYWDKWTELGIMEKVSVQRGERGKKLFSLSEIGITKFNI